VVLETEFCILGGGIMGLATAYAISDHNKKIVLVDRYGVGNEQCSSCDVNRVFRYSYGNDELYVRMAIESLKLWRTLEDESEKQLLIRTGLLMLMGEDKGANGFNESSYATLSRMGLGAERLDHEGIRRRFPRFNAKGALFDPHGGVILASEAIATLSSLADRRGVRFRKDQATRIRVDDRPRIETASGETIRFQKLIVTVGPWSNSLLGNGLTPIRPTRQQLVYFKPRNGLDRFRPPSCPVFFTDTHYGLPAAGIDAVKVSPKELSESVDPETAKRSVDDEQIVDCREACRNYVSDIADGEVVRTKVCLYDMTENADFVLDRDPDHSNVIYGYGFSGHGFKFAPLIGKLLSELALDEKLGFDLERFSARPARRRPPTLGAHLGKGE
jgi:sarcosine oxidase